MGARHGASPVAKQPNSSRCKMSSAGTRNASKILAIGLLVRSSVPLGPLIMSIEGKKPASKKAAKPERSTGRRKAG